MVSFNHTKNLNRQKKPLRKQTGLFMKRIESICFNYTKAVIDQFTDTKGSKWGKNIAYGKIRYTFALGKYLVIGY
jgi:hypothetical protein